MIRVIKTILCISIIGFSLSSTRQVRALIPSYYFPTIKSIEKESLSIGNYAYQLLYFGQIEESLNLAKLAVKINKKNEKLWLILSEAQVANQQYKEALISLNKAQNINSKISEIYFAKSNIYLKITELNNAKIALRKGLKIEPNNHKAMFQLGNIFLMEKNYSKAIKYFDKAVEIKNDFWQAINNKGLAFFETDNIKLSIQFFEQAISVEENAEPLLGLASCLRTKDYKESLKLAKKALEKDPNYVNYKFRKEQLWGEKLQESTEILLQSEELQIDIILAKSKINEPS